MTKLLMLFGSILVVFVCSAGAASAEDCEPANSTIWAKAANEDFSYKTDLGEHCLAYRFKNSPGAPLTRISLFDVSANRPVIEKFFLPACGNQEDCESRTAVLLTYVETASPSDARLSYGGILGDRYHEPVKTQLRTDIAPAPQSISKRIWSRIVGWFGTSSGEVVKVDVTIQMQFSAEKSSIDYDVLVLDSNYGSFAYMGDSQKTPLAPVWLKQLPGEKALALDIYAGFWDEPRAVAYREPLVATIPAKEWVLESDRLVLNYWNEKEKRSEEILSFAVPTIAPR